MAERIKATVEGPEWLEYDPSLEVVTIKTAAGRFVISPRGAGGGVCVRSADGELLQLEPHSGNSLVVREVTRELPF